MKVNLTDIIKCGNKLYYDINPNSKMDVPSIFFEKLEQDWIKWKKNNIKISFYEYCKNKYVLN
jgi:hypothetical protein